MNPEFTIETVATTPGTVVLRVTGRLDARSAPVLTARCVEVRNQGRHLVLTMAGVSFIASSGIGALLALVEEFRQSESRLRLAAISPAVESVVRLLNLDQFLTIDATEAEATTALEAA